MTAEICSMYDLSQCHSLQGPPRIGIFLWWLVSKKDPWSRKCVIFKLKSNQKCYIFGDFLNCTMFNSSMWGSLTSLKVRQCRNVFFQADYSSKKRTNEFIFLPNSTMIELFRSFFGRIVGLEKTLRLCLTFNKVRLPYILLLNMVQFTKSPNM